MTVFIIESVVAIPLIILFILSIINRRFRVIFYTATCLAAYIVSVICFIYNNILFVIIGAFIVVIYTVISYVIYFKYKKDLNY